MLAATPSFNAPGMRVWLGPPTPEWGCIQATPASPGGRGRVRLVAAEPVEVDVADRLLAAREPPPQQPDDEAEHEQARPDQRRHDHRQHGTWSRHGGHDTYKRHAAWHLQPARGDWHLQPARGAWHLQPTRGEWHLHSTQSMPSATGKWNVTCNQYGARHLQPPHSITPAAATGSNGSCVDSPHKNVVLGSTAHVTAVVMALWP